jgi:hypothetical protein
MSVVYTPNDETALDVAATIAAGIAERSAPYHEPIRFVYHGTTLQYDFAAPSAATIVRDWFLAHYDYSDDEATDGDE